VLNIDNNRLLQGDSVSLQPLSLKHLDALCEIGLDEGLWQWIPKPVQSRDDMRAYVEAALSGKAQGHMEPFAISENGSGALVGSTRFGAISLPNKRLEIGWTWIGTKWQRTAVNTETKLIMLRYAFENLNCNRVEFKTDSLNERSRNAILRLGAQQEGILRKHIVTASGRLRDTVYFSIVNEEWPRVRANLEGKLARYAS
jgi:RimJ/RimL family protein N-acetyltransferase